MPSYSSPSIPTPAVNFARIDGGEPDTPTFDEVKDGGDPTTVIFDEIMDGGGPTNSF
jgi:hypothetical protein